MADQKKSFVLYGDLIHTTQHLTNEDAGKVFKWVLEYVNDKEPKPLKGLLAAVCEPIKQQLKRDLLKYQSKREQYSEAGKRSAEARKLKKLKEKEIQQTLTNVESRSTNSTVSVNDNVNVTVNVNDIINREAEFKNSLQPFLDKYGKDMLNDFYLYWTEKNTNGKKMKFEMNKTFDVSRRLSRWSKNNFNIGKNGKQQQQQQLGEITETIRINDPNV